MDDRNHQPPFVTGIRALARRLGLPPIVLRTRLEAGGLPHLERGGRLLFHVPTVEKALAETATPATPAPGGRR